MNFLWIFEVEKGKNQHLREFAFEVRALVFSWFNHSYLSNQVTYSPPMYLKLMVIWMFWWANMLRYFEIKNKFMVSKNNKTYLCRFARRSGKIRLNHPYLSNQVTYSSTQPKLKVQQITMKIILLLLITYLRPTSFVLFLMYPAAK